MGSCIQNIYCAFIVNDTNKIINYEANYHYLLTMKEVSDINIGIGNGNK